MYTPNVTMKKSSDLRGRRPLHVVFFPLMATGHMRPMVDMANLVAARGDVAATVVATPSNAALLDSHLLPGSAVSIRILPFPSPALTGLPPGAENLADLLDRDSHSRFTDVVLRLLREPFSHLLRELRPVDVVIADYFFPWTIPEAEELGIPCLLFHGISFFALCATAAVAAAAIAPTDTNPLHCGATVVLGGLPHRVEMLRSQMRDVGQAPPQFSELLDEIARMEGRSYGVVVNSFYELEPDYVRHFREATGHRTWHVGPVALHNQDDGALQKKPRRQKETKDEEEQGQKQEQATEPIGPNSYRSEWLDRNQPGSVLYVCFGSMGRLGAAQLSQLAFGLEASMCPFVWVVGDSDDDAEWMPHGFKERVRDRGLVLKEWAPQTLILRHTSVGGFVTHCGWNSCLEGVSAGVPMITWPLFGEQFFNERLIVDVLRIDAPVGATKFARFSTERPVIEAALIETAIKKVMSECEDAVEMRRRVRELGEAAKRAMEPGGSSYADLENLIQELMDRREVIAIKD